MVSTSRHTTRRSRRPTTVAKPSGSIHPRVQNVGPEHFGIVAVDCAKTRSKWMLTDFYGNIFIGPTVVEHTRRGLDDFTARIRRAMTEQDLHDLVVAVERTGAYHAPIKRAATTAGFEARIVHPLTSKQFRLPADPGNKTDETDLFAIQRAAVNGFGLIEPALDQTHLQLRLLARHRRDLIRKNADLRNQIHAELDALLPGLSAAVGGIFDHEPALVIARHLGSAQAIQQSGLNGLAALLDAEHVRYQRRSLEKILAWADQAHESAECPEIHQRIFAHLDDERRARLRSIRCIESDLAGLLVQTPYALLLSFPGINVVSAAEFAGEMGPIANTPSDSAITGRAGLYPSRYQSDRVDHTGPLVSRANRSLRYVLLLIAQNLLRCNEHFHALGQAWRRSGVDWRVVVVRAAKRFSRIAYQMVAGRQVFRHPSCRERHYILQKLLIFYCEHDTPTEQMLRDLRRAVDGIPPQEYAAEAEHLRGLVPPVRGTGASRPPARSHQGTPPPNSRAGHTGPRDVRTILPAIFLRLGVTMVESNPSGETDSTRPRTADGLDNA
jgi:transposase